MEPFAFSTSQSQEENIESFIYYLEQANPVFGDLIKKHVSELERFSELSPNEKNKLRNMIAEEVKNMLNIDQGEKD